MGPWRGVLPYKAFTGKKLIKWNGYDEARQTSLLLY